MLLGVSEGCGEVGDRCVQVILRLNLKQLGLGEIDIGEADVQAGFELIFFERR